MEHEIKTISGAFLRSSIKSIKRIRRGDYSPEKHNKRLHLEDKAGMYFALYAQDLLKVENKDKEIFAEYIDVFAQTEEREKLLDKLQKESSFDVRKYLETSSLSFWQRIFPKKKSMSSFSMKRKISKFARLYKKLNKDGFHNTSDVNLFQKLGEEAEDYITAYNNGNFVPKDKELFESYVKTLGNFYENSPAVDALDKLRKERTESKKEKAPYKPKTTKIFSINGKGLKYAAAVAFGFAISWFGLKSDSSAKYQSKADYKVAKKADKPVVRDTSKTADTGVWNSYAKKHENTLKHNTQHKASEELNLDRHQKDMKDFYAKRVAQFTSKAKAKKMMADFAEKVDSGIVSLPNDISMNRFLYAGQIYREYGFKSIAKEFADAVNSDKPLSKQTQEKLFKYVRDAGDKGVGVQKMSQQKVKNLKQLRDIRGR